MIRGLFNSFRRQPVAVQAPKEESNNKDVEQKEENKINQVEEEPDMSERKSDEEVKQLVQIMRDWLNSQPHLPKDVGDYLLLRFVHSCYYDVEKAKVAADLFFTIRSSSPELFLNRDPSSPQMQKVFSFLNLTHLQISGNRNLWVWQLNDPGLDNYEYIPDVKCFMLCVDMDILKEPRLEDADICIMDVKDISMKMLTKINMSVAKKLSKYQQDAVPIRLKQIHLVNAPSFIDKIFGVIKAFLKPEITELIHFHSPKSQTLYKFISKDDLPADYGGNLGRMEDYMKVTLEHLNEYRDRLTTSLWRNTDKDKKSKYNKKDDGPSEETSFRSLAID